MNVDPGIRLIENSNHYNFARAIIVSKRTVVELEQGDRVRGVTESGVNPSIAVDTEVLRFVRISLISNRLLNRIYKDFLSSPLSSLYITTQYYYRYYRRLYLRSFS